MGSSKKTLIIYSCSAKDVEFSAGVFFFSVSGVSLRRESDARPYDCAVIAKRRYVLKRLAIALLGKGGMGKAYRARDTKRDYPERMLRFQREAQALASLNHLNFAAIYGIQEGR